MPINPTNVLVLLAKKMESYIRLHRKAIQNLKSSFKKSVLLMCDTSKKYERIRSNSIQCLEVVKEIQDSVEDIKLLYHLMTAAALLYLVPDSESVDKERSGTLFFFDQDMERIGVVPHSLPASNGVDILDILPRILENLGVQKEDFSSFVAHVYKREEVIQGNLGALWGCCVTDENGIQGRSLSEEQVRTIIEEDQFLVFYPTVSSLKTGDYYYCHSEGWKQFHNSHCDRVSGLATVH